MKIASRQRIFRTLDLIGRVQYNIDLAVHLHHIHHGRTKKKVEKIREVTSAHVRTSECQTKSTRHIKSPKKREETKF